MASKSTSRRWILLALIALGVAVVAALPRGASEDAVQDAEPKEARETSRTQVVSPEQQLDAGMASRRIAEGCDPLDESLKYEEFIGRRALAVLSWDGLSERAANLRIPVYVVGIEDGAVGVRVLEIPMREQYLIVWMRSGHLRRGTKDTFLLDPCSAMIEAWTTMERATDPDIEDDLDEDGLLKDEYLLDDE